MRSLFILLISFTMVACASRKNGFSHVRQPWEPDAFQLSYTPSPVFGGGEMLEWDGRCLVERISQIKFVKDRQVWKNVWKKKQAYHPTKDQWVYFWARAEELKLAQWRKRYSPSDIGQEVFDGGSWSFRAQNGQTRIETSGDNAGPDLPNVLKTKIGSEAIEPLADEVEKLKQSK